MTAAEAPPAVRGDRLVVPDVLRGFALFAMLVAHARPFLVDVPPAADLVMTSLNDVASPLFALVMGIAAQIMLQRTPPGGTMMLLAQQVMRGAVLILLGVLLSLWDSWVAIVLAHLGVLLLVGAPLVLLRTRWLAAAAIIVAVLSEPINTWARATLGPVAAADPSLAELLNWVVLGQHYRLTNLLPFFLLGALLYRHGFRRDRALAVLAIIAPLAYAVQPVVAALAGPRPTAAGAVAPLTGSPAVSGSYVDTLHDVGLVFAVYVVVVLLATVRAPGAARVIDACFVPFRALGAVALSLYVFHVALLAFGLQPGFDGASSDWLRWAVVVIGVSVLGWLWWRLIGLGPVEWLLGWVIGRRKPFRRRPS
jgi:uncharacterized protein